ncbi:MAG TPA: hypothetical protein VHP37_09545 [Burkholderiales bacterium]|nr:hypothetical protein [Burkholderiales bacterium]
MKRHAWKALLVALLAADAVYYALAGTPSKAVDAAAWLVLLVLFEIEARCVRADTPEGYRSALRFARLIAAAGVVAATAGYLFEDNVLDTVNSGVWIAVVILLEVEFRYPSLVARARVAFGSVAVALYGGLAALVAIWAWRGEWFDAYDAALWLIAFATIEMDAVKA